MAYVQCGRAAVPRLAAPIILTVVAGVLAGCGQSATSEAVSSAPGSLVAAEASAPAEASAEESTPAATPTPTVGEAQEVHVEWTVPFSLTIPPTWERSGSRDVIEFQAEADRWVVFSLLGPATVQEWSDQLTSAERYVTTVPAPVELGGAPGVVFDVETADPEQPAILFQDAARGMSWEVAGNRPNRVWIVDVGGRPVLIVTDAPDRAFEGWVAEAEEVLSTLTWD